MLFTPFKRHANRFNYIPRFYDPAKEAREERRAELRGERLSDRDKEYTPGQYIRTQRAARAARKATKSAGGQHKLLKYVAIGALIFLLVYILYPRLLQVVGSATEVQPRASQVEAPAEEFDPYAPITIVPNDYVAE